MDLGREMLTHRILSLIPNVRFKNYDRRLIKKLFWLLPPLVIITLLTLANWYFPLPKARLHPPPSQIVLDRNGEWLRAFLADDGMWRIAVSHQPSASSPSFEGSQKSRAENHSLLLHQAILTVEDRWFYYHYGINPISIATTLYDNLKAGEVVRGGSTITMQLARLMEPKARTIPNKLIEMFRALQLEHAYSKSEILTFYFNMLPYGGNIVGTGAASRFYFNKPQNALSLGEAALLAAIPNSPERLRPDRFPENARKAREKVLNRLLARRQISKQEWQEASQEPIPKKRYPLPFKAPHLSRMLAKRNQQRTDGRVYTTIDVKVQETAARILGEYLDATGKSNFQGAHIASTGAIVIMDTQNREVLAMVGSHDFFDQGALGQINGTLAPRSPGSALKPFVYALAMEQGLITPETLLFDVPVNYAGYEPVNYDGKYNGYVTARQALARSLNVPAVNLSARLKDVTLHTFLKQAGISTLAPAEKYGLSMVLGGCEVNLLELTTLYAGLANMGEFEPYQLVNSGQSSAAQAFGNPLSIKGKGGTVEPASALTDNRQPITDNHSKRLLRPETSFIITEMLTTSQRPTNALKSSEVFERTMNLPKIAWKTGTSYGHRDAWCIGYSPTLTIGVWLGNFDGRGSPMLSGTDAATPILFALFSALTGQDTHRWFTEPERLKTRQVCALSGAPVSPHCPTHKSDVYVPGISPVATCTIHKRIYVDETTGYSLCSHCRISNAGNLDTDPLHSTAVLREVQLAPRDQRALTSPDPLVKRSGAKTRVNSLKIFEEWPPEAATWLAENGFAVPVLPEHNPLCTGTIAGSAPIILSPAKDTTYYIRAGVPLENQKIRLSASASNRTQNLFWFLDGALIYKGNAGKEYWLTPVKGQHVLTCVDAEGRSASRSLHISVIQ